MSGYCECKCRDCFDVAITSTDKNDFCWECKEAGCEEDSECCRDPEDEEDGEY